jgi:hypothetical protein
MPYTPKGQSFGAMSDLSRLFFRLLPKYHRLTVSETGQSPNRF